MWKLLYHSILEFEVKDFNSHNHQNKDSTYSNPNEEKNSKNKTNTYVILYEKKVIGHLHGNQILKLEIETFYSELIRTVSPIEIDCLSIKKTLSIIVNRIIKDKDSFIAPEDLEILQKSSSEEIVPFMKNIYCLDSSELSKLRLYHICNTTYFKQIKNKYSKKWNTIVAMKDFKVTKLYYKKHLLIGFSLYREEDGEQFFWSGQFQEVLESLIIK
ncbi:hypothetical protein [uncultured Zobellia sp.]|uniref:hypothetical protein n=1 Tax=uncultured Zobellia sp. TaxID=255433 RepID=UPI002592A416|nr:hypothetical protein [uncultured Zobellia sp.]